MTEPVRDAVVEVRVARIANIFQTLDPSPFRERDLDRDAEEFIVDWARELPADAPIRIVIHLGAAEAEPGAAAEVADAIRQYFAGRADEAGRDLHELHRQGRQALAVGVPLLAACLAASQAVQNLVENPGLVRTVGESLLILGWVANWRPLEIFLYDRAPILRRQRLYRRLAEATVELRTASDGGAVPPRRPIG